MEIVLFIVSLRMKMYENIARERLLLFDLPDKRTDRIKLKKKENYVLPIINHLGNRDLQS